MTRGNRMLSTLVLLGLLTLSVNSAARSQNVPPKTFTIRGATGLAYMTLQGFPGTAVRTDENGFYSVEVPQGWAGTVTPIKVGFAFVPPSRTYTAVAAGYENQDYTATLLTFRISGTVGLADVRMEGLPEEVVTDSRGEYSAAVPYGWAGVVKPVKPGYTFVPPTRQYSPLRRDQAEQDYAPSVITFVISGKVGEADVAMCGLPGNPTTDHHGVYRATVDTGWSGTVTPTKEGYRFEPPSCEYSQVFNDQANQDYRAVRLTYTISGSVGLPGVRIEGFPRDVVSDENGGYQVQVAYGWSGKVSPRKPGYRFEPADRQYIIKIREDLPQQDYRPRIVTYIISGSTGVPGVMMNGLPEAPVSDAQGRYEARVEHGWCGVVAPFKEGFVFTPPKRAYDTPMMANVTNQNYTAQERMVTISNVIRVGREPIQGVRVTAKPGEYTALTDSQGRYSLKVPYGWSGSLTFFKPELDIVGDVKHRNVTADVIDGKSVPAEDEWPPYPSGGSRGGVAVPAGDVLVIPTGDAAPQRIAETTEDLRVMLQILREKLSEPRMIRGVLRDYGSLLGEDRRAEAIYLQGSAALFVLGADFPPSTPAQGPGEGEPQGRPQGETADPVWQQARQKLYSPGARTPGPSGQTQAMTFEQFKEELLRSLRHAANIRHIDPNELIVLTLVAQNERTNRTLLETELLEEYNRINGITVAAATVLTMQAKKADIDAFAQGTLDFDQFRRKVKSLAY